MSGDVRFTRQFENDFQIFKANNQDFALGCPSWAKGLFDILNTTQNTDGSPEYLDINEIENFFLLLKGDDPKNTDFIIDEAQFDTFKKRAGITDEMNITKHQVESFLWSMTKNIYGRLSETTRKTDFHIDNDVETYLNKLNSDISFETENKNFNNIIALFDTKIKDGKISPDEAKNLWNTISQKCTVEKDGEIILDENKITDFIKENLKNAGVTVEDFVSFVNTFSMAIKNTDSDNNIDWEKAHITKPNGKVDGYCKQNSGDCYLTATLYSFSLSEEGRAILNDCITKDNNGNIYVHLKGAKETYIVTPEDLKNYKFNIPRRPNSGPLDGDGDLRAIEIAYAKHRSRRNEDIDSGDSRIATFLITGIDCSNLRTEVSDGKNYAREDLDMNYDNNYVIVAGISNLNGKKAEGYMITEDGKEKSIGLLGQHAYAVSRLDDDNVYVIDTNNDISDDVKKSEIRIPKDKFYEIFHNFSPINLNAQNTIVHSSINEKLYMMRVKNNPNINETDYRNWIIQNFNDKQKLILSKFQQLDKFTDPEKLNTYYSRASLKYFMNAINKCLKDNNTTSFNDICYQQLRQILNIGNDENISNEDLKDFYQAIISTL